MRGWRRKFLTNSLIWVIINKVEMTVIFIDLDGTIIKTVVPKAVERCLKETGISLQDLKVAMYKPQESDSDNDIFMACMKIFSEEIIKAEPFPETIKALISISCSASVIISSRAPLEAIEEWADKNGLYLCDCFGREDGEKSTHIEEGLWLDDYCQAIFIGNEPSDFCIDEKVVDGMDVVKIAVNVTSCDKFPEDVHVYPGPLTKEILDQFI
jgi:hypothetical protein